MAAAWQSCVFDSNQLHQLWLRWWLTRLWEMVCRPQPVSLGMTSNSLQPVSLGMTSNRLSDMLACSERRGMNDGPFRSPTKPPPGKSKKAAGTLLCCPTFHSASGSVHSCWCVTALSSARGSA